MYHINNRKYCFKRFSKIFKCLRTNNKNRKEILFVFRPTRDIFMNISKEQYFIDPPTVNIGRDIYCQLLYFLF